MIEVVTAFFGVKDTSSVTLEIVVGSINGDTSWSRLDGGFKGSNALGFDSFVGNSVNNSFGGFGFAMLGLCYVWVGRL